MLDAIANTPAVEWFGYLCVVAFSCSFLTKSEVGLLRMQLVGALGWVVYGVWKSAMPVVVANLVVAVLSVFKQVRIARSAGRNEAGSATR